MAHQLEFDGGIVLEELNWCNLVGLQKVWTNAARNGYCTMNPEIGRWIRQNCGEDGTSESKPCVGLKRTTELVLPHRLEFLVANHHKADVDSLVAGEITHTC